MQGLLSWSSRDTLWNSCPDIKHTVLVNVCTPNSDHDKTKLNSPADLWWQSKLYN